ncbi:MAG: oligosaccharide flippase family protein [Deltaproteobacteria bacterium]|nr:oligosaccharide flippase family protein [Deltaproteobacteria bacterium]
MQQEPHPLPGGLWKRNALLNLAGLGLPLCAALVAVPILLRALGQDRFGVLTLAWALVSYFGVFDLGLGRALTKLVAERIGSRDEQELPGLISSSLTWLVLLGLGTGALLYGAAPWIATRGLSLPSHLHQETREGLRILALSLPVVLPSTGLRGLLEAHQKFARITAIRIPMGVLAFAGPLIVLPYSSRLAAVLAVLVVARIVGFVAYLFSCRHWLPRLPQWTSWNRSLSLQALHLGGWMTVSNLVSPLLLYLDRFVIAALLPVAAVAFYATPFEVVSRLGIVPAALMGVLFPAFSSTLATAPGEARRLYHRSQQILLVALLPLAALVVIFARPALTLWLGEEFAQASYRVAQIFAVSAVVHGLAQPSFHLLQAAGRPKTTALLHLLEAPLYLLYLLPLTLHFGIVGTATAALLRVTFSCLALSFLARRIISPRGLAAEANQPGSGGLP